MIDCANGELVALPTSSARRLSPDSTAAVAASGAMTARAATAQSMRPRTAGHTAYTIAPTTSSGMSITAVWIINGCAGSPRILVGTRNLRRDRGHLTCDHHARIPGLVRPWQGWVMPRATATSTSVDASATGDPGSTDAD